MSRFILTCFLLSLSIISFSQNANNDFRFILSDSIIVKNQNDSILNLTWTGGLNTAQFSNIDIDLDGKKDLFIFERNGNKIINLLNKSSIQNEIKLINSISYIDNFPPLHDWALLSDYNNDGKEDIFSYSNGGIAVYKNTTSSSTLQFSKITTSLLADFGSGNYTNIYVSSVDIPAITDIDNDGDLDILSFHILGLYLQLYINLSVEKYGNSDSLDFVLANNCWGNFKESENANKISLNIDCPYAKMLLNLPEKALRHTGSTITSLDLNNDSNPDLLIGDIDSRNMYALYSNSSGTDAIINQYDSIFPVYDSSINVTSMPAAFYLDINNDNKKDLIISPNDSRISDSYRGIWYYENLGANVFNLKEKGFLQNDMIDVGQHSYPILNDYDNDGLIDLIIGNYGTYAGSKDSIGTIFTNYISKIHFYKNIGTLTKPSFKLISNDLANLSSLKTIGLFPTFGDLNNDGKNELILGDQNGKLHYLENQSTDANNPDFHIISSNYANIDIGNFSAPQLVDLNRDGLLDIVSGSKDGKLYYFQNTGSINNPIFSNTPTISKLGNVLVTDTLNSNFGYSKPYFYDLNGTWRLIVGSQSGKLFYYSNIDNNLNGNFVLANSNYLSEHIGSYSAFTMKDLDNDNFPDAIIGNEAGGLNFYKGVKPWGVGIEEKNNLNITIFPNPCSTEFSIENLNISQITILNAEGRTIQAFYSNSNKYILRPDIKNGIYMLKIEDNKNQFYYKKLSIIR